MIDLENELSKFIPTKSENFYELKLPIVMHMTNTFLVVRIAESDNSYRIFDRGSTFEEFNNHTNYYYKLFCQYNPGKFKRIKTENEFIYLDISKSDNLNDALDEFIRFFIELDNFILYNKIV